MPLAPGQTRPLVFRMTFQGPLPPCVSIVITYAFAEHPEQLFEALIRHTFVVARLYEAHKFTFLHPGGIVSYALLKPPSRKVCTRENSIKTLPILLVLHGAGVEADNNQVRQQLDSFQDLAAWVLCPTGVTPWSSDDWRE